MRGHRDTQSWEIGSWILQEDFYIVNFYLSKPGRIYSHDMINTGRSDSSKPILPALPWKSENGIPVSVWNLIHRPLVIVIVVETFRETHPFRSATARDGIRRGCTESMRAGYARDI